MTNLLNRQQCQALRGIAIIGIFLHNYCHWLKGIVRENEYQYFERNVSGLGEEGKPALLLFYTAAGGNNLWSAERGAKRTQRIAVSTDGGIRSGNTAVLVAKDR